MGETASDRLAGQSVLITGASSGIGAELARQLAGRGARVGLLARRGERLEALAEEIRSAGGEAVWAVADVTDPEGLEDSLERIARELGGADIVVANAGTNLDERPRKYEAGTALQLYDINLMGMLRLIDWAYHRFLEQGSGQIVGISSVASYFGLPANPSYCGSKAAMRIHLQSLRVTLARHGVAVTTICPGFVKSELTDRLKAPMPFLTDTEPAVRRIVRAIERREAEVIFPWPWRVIVPLMGAVPRFAFEWLLRRGA